MTLGYYLVLLDIMKMENGKTVRTCISLETEVFQIGKVLAQKTGHPFSFSGYVNDLIKKDIACRIAPPARQSASMST